MAGIRELAEANTYKCPWTTFTQAHTQMYIFTDKCPTLPAGEILTVLTGRAPSRHHVCARVTS